VPKNESALNGFLYTIAKNKWLNHLNSAKYRKTNSYDVDPHMLNNKTAENDKEFDNDNNINTVANAFNNLGDVCKKLLTAFYYDNKSLREIAKIFEITEASAKNKKYRCTEKLRSLVVKPS
jgi:RNA polymerase sigma factor (sigma-70 family)